VSEGKSVLVVSHAFWPTNVIGAMRPLHLVANLLDKGYEPIVLMFDHWDRTLDDREYGKETAQRVRTVRVHLFGIVNWLRRANAALLPSARQDVGKKRAGPTAGGAVRAMLRKGIVVLDGACDVPLSVAGILMQGMWLGFRNRLDGVFCTAPLFRTLAASALVAKWLHIPLVADFRDLWTLNEYYNTRGRFFRTRIEGWVERFVVNSAAYLIYNTDTAKDLMDAKYPASSDRSFAITNGIVLGEERTGIGVDYDRPFTITHVGSLYLERNPNDFFEGLKQWIERRGDDVRGRVAVRLVGRGTEHAAARARSMGLDAVIETVPQKTKPELAEVFAQSHLLLVCLGYRETSRYVVPAKMYDYIAANRPVIAYAPRDGEVVRLMNELGLEDNVVTGPDERRTQDILDREFDRYLARNSEFFVPPDLKARYNYTAIADRIEQVIARALEEHRKGEKKWTGMPQ